MKKTLPIFTAAAGMLLFCGAPAMAQEETTFVGDKLELKSSSGGTFYRNDEPSTTDSKYWISDTKPAITITDGNNKNDMKADSNYSEGFLMYEGSGNTDDKYTMTVSGDSVITGMSLKIVTDATDGQIPTVIIGDQSVVSTSEPQEMIVTGLNAQTIIVELTSTSAQGHATLYDWVVYVDAAEDFSETYPVELEGKTVIAVSPDYLSDFPVEGQWYIMKQSRGGFTPAYDSGTEVRRAATTDTWTPIGAAATADNVAKYLLRFIEDTELVSSSETETPKKVYHLQWGTGQFWADMEGITTDNTSVKTSNYSMGSYNMYAHPELTIPDGYTGAFALNVFDMGMLINNNGAGAAVDLFHDGAVYDLSGRKVTNPRGGIYIKDGKKVIIK